MPRLTFPVAAVAAEIEAVRRAPAHRPHGDESGPGFWLVGDQGVYLMGNQERAALAPGESYPIIYARECPKGDWNAKVAIYGGDDGVDFLPLAQVEAWISAAQAEGRTTATVEITPEHLALDMARAA